MKVGHVGKQPTSPDGGLESVSQIFHGDTNHARVSQKCHATSKSTWLTLINRSLFWARKGLRSVLSYFFPSDSRINLHTCKSNVKQLYLLKNPNSLQEGPVSNLQIRCVMLVNVIFLSIKLYHHWSLLSCYVVAPKGAVYDLRSLTAPEVSPLDLWGVRSSRLAQRLFCGVSTPSNAWWGCRVLLL